MCSPCRGVGFLRRFGLKTGIDFAHFGLESDMVFEGTTGVPNVLIVQFQINKKKRVICISRNGFFIDLFFW